MSVHDNSYNPTRANCLSFAFFNIWKEIWKIWIPFSQLSRENIKTLARGLALYGLQTKSCYHPIFVNIVLLEDSHAHSFTFHQPVFMLWKHNWVAETETVWPVNTEIFIISSFTKCLLTLHVGVQRWWSFKAFLSQEEDQSVLFTGIKKTWGIKRCFKGSTQGRLVKKNGPCLELIKTSHVIQPEQ